MENLACMGIKAGVEMYGSQDVIWLLEFGNTICIVSSIAHAVHSVKLVKDI